MLVHMVQYTRYIVDIVYTDTGGRRTLIDTNQEATG